MAAAAGVLAGGARPIEGSASVRRRPGAERPPRDVGAQTRTRARARARVRSRRVVARVAADGDVGGDGLAAVDNAVVFVVNPSSGAGRCGAEWAARGAAAIAAVEAATGLRAYALYTGRAGDAERLARAAASGGAAAVVAVGGDGTVHEVLNGLFERERTPDEGSAWPPAQRRAVRVGTAALGVLPCGTGSDLARTLLAGGEDGSKGGNGQGWEREWESALRTLCEWRAQPLDVGRVSCRGARAHHFANISSVGVSASSGRHVGGLKALGARVAYGAATALAFVRYSPPALDLELQSGDAGSRRGEAEETRVERMERVAALCVANCEYFGGGFRVAPDADPRDGALDAVGLEGFGLSGFALLGGKLRAGEHMDIPGVSNRRATSLLVSVADEPGHAVERPGGPCSLRSPLDGDEGDASLWGEDVPPAPIDVEADGEMVGALPALYECLPGAIDVIC